MSYVDNAGADTTDAAVHQFMWSRPASQQDALNLVAWQPWIGHRTTTGGDINFWYPDAVALWCEVMLFDPTTEVQAQRFR